MKIYSIYNLIWVIVILASCFIVYNYFIDNHVKIAYVRTGYIFDNYDLTQELEQSLQEKSKEYNKELDSLKSIIDTLVIELNESNSLSKQLKIYKEDHFNRLLKRIDTKQKEYNYKLNQHEKELTNSVFQKINIYMKDYGKENGYDFIFGTTSSGNILYGSESLDITDDLLEKLNESYNEEKKNK